MGRFQSTGSWILASGKSDEPILSALGSVVVLDIESPCPLLDAAKTCHAQRVAAGRLHPTPRLARDRARRQQHEVVPSLDDLPIHPEAGGDGLTQKLNTWA